ncbi:MAG: hypothetical protein AAF629_05265 [Chloroflexota bacterium]
MGKLLQMLGGSSADPGKTNSNTVTAIAELMERNRRFEYFMRRKVADLEEKVVLDEASEVDLAPSVAGHPPEIEDLQTELEPIRATEDPFPEPGLSDTPALDEWDDDWEVEDVASLTPEISPPITIQSEPPTTPIRLAPSTDDWQQIPGILGNAESAPSDEIEEPEADVTEWDTTLPDGELSAFE